MVKTFLAIILLTSLLVGCGEQSVKKTTEPMIQTKKSKVSAECPSVKRARHWAEKREGVSFALICRGKVEGYHQGRHLPSASTGKALLLLAALRSGQVNKPLLGRMIRQSDNQAAHTVYAGLGDKPLRQASKRARLKSTRLCGCWSFISWSAADYARLFNSLPRSLPKQNRRWAMKQLKSITSSQRWGIADASQGYKTYFKGGWRPEENGWLVLQGALLIKNKERLALAVWTDENPSLQAGAAKIKRVTKLILTSQARADDRSDKTQSSF